MLLVIGYPVYYTVYLSFFDTPPSLALEDKTYVGVDNYLRILGSEAFREVTWNTAVWTVFSTFFAFVLGLGAALSLNRAFIGRGMLRGILLIPYVISGVAASYIWRWLYHSDFGVISAILIEFGITDHPLNLIDNTETVLPALIVVNVWKEFPFAMIMLLAGLQTVPDQLHRAAQVDGAGPWHRFWHITFPHLRGVTVVTTLLLLVANLNSFIIPWIMTGGGPVGASDIWITAIYQLAFERTRFGLASAYSVILFVVMMSLGYFYVRALSRGSKEAAE
ncbi:carbohydrate ABC transporter permease [Roseomonas elaeocarpi]|uniref:Carbohydrate ABC transporter permease n=2 Tax=Roseomonas elaeocarpi TaxID=907779 RepID=A0ABV6JM27_9PROT